MVKGLDVYAIDFNFYICFSFYKMISLCMCVCNWSIKNMTMLFGKRALRNLVGSKNNSSSKSGGEFS